MHRNTIMDQKPRTPISFRLTAQGKRKATSRSKMMKRMEEMQGKSMGGGMSGPMGDNGPSSLALNAIAMKMHNAMSMTYTGNADVDFVKGMIPHHQAAIDMAKTVIAFGKDPQVKKLAEDVIKAQEAEITVMTEWIKKQSQPQP